MNTETLTDRELDAAIAEKVFGGPQANVQWYWWKSSTPSLAIDPPLYAGPYFSTAIADAWMIVERMRDQYNEIEIRETALSRPYTTVVICGHDEVVADTTPMAICLAALKAVKS